MKSNELRIGNWMVIGTLGKCKITVEAFRELSYFPEIINSIEPIPLTSEILEKAGFVSSFSGDDFHTGILWRVKNTEYLYCEDGYFVDNCGYYGHYCDIGDVKYLHQLQNLYFALTGEELPIEL